MVDDAERQHEERRAEHGDVQQPLGEERADDRARAGLGARRHEHDAERVARAPGQDVVAHVADRDERVRVRPVRSRAVVLEQPALAAHRRGDEVQRDCRAQREPLRAGVGQLRRLLPERPDDHARERRDRHGRATMSRYASRSCGSASRMIRPPRPRRRPARAPRRRSTGPRRRGRRRSAGACAPSAPGPPRSRRSGRRRSNVRMPCCRRISFVRVALDEDVLSSQTSSSMCSRCPGAGSPAGACCPSSFRPPVWCSRYPASCTTSTVSATRSTSAMSVMGADRQPRRLAQLGRGSRSRRAHVRVVLDMVPLCSSATPAAANACLYPPTHRPAVARVGANLATAAADASVAERHDRGSRGAVRRVPVPLGSWRAGCYSVARARSQPDTRATSARLTGTSSPACSASRTIAPFSVSISVRRPASTS